MASSASSTHFLIDQQVEVAKNFLQSNIQPSQDNNLEELSKVVRERNTLIDNAKSTGSYQVILEQSLTTQDKPFLYEILIENDPSIIQNSLAGLSPKRVIQLLKMIKFLLEQHIKLGKGQDHCLSIASWLETLLRLHLTTIVANVQNKQTIISIKKFLQKKTSKKSQLKEIKSHLLSQSAAQQLQDLSHKNSQRKNPKFQYIEEEKEHIEEEEQNQQGSEINDEDMEDLEMDDLDMDEFMDDDF